MQVRVTYKTHEVTAAIAVILCEPLHDVERLMHIADEMQDPGYEMVGEIQNSIPIQPPDRTFIAKHGRVHFSTSETREHAAHRYTAAARYCLSTSPPVASKPRIRCGQKRTIDVLIHADKWCANDRGQVRKLTPREPL